MMSPVITRAVAAEGSQRDLLAARAEKGQLLHSLPCLPALLGCLKLKTDVALRVHYVENMADTHCQSKDLPVTSV
jgi:hypothetical protein